ncbi:MAG: hypothetical protein QM648_01855 [Solirubrobacterales bacterium]
MKTRLTFLTAALLAFVLIAPRVEAKDYVVHTCHLPDGRVAPADGWSTTGWASYGWYKNACAENGPLMAGLAGASQPANHSDIGWGFDSGAAPIRGYRIVRAGTPRGWKPGSSMVLYTSDKINYPGAGVVVDYCAVYSGCGSIAGLLARSVPAIPEDSHGWFMTIGCGGMTDETCTLASGQPDFGSFQIDSASFTLADEEQPRASSVDGTLTQSGAIAGSLVFTASDSVTGVRRAAIEVDGAEVAAVTPDSNNGRCAEIGLAGALPDFTHRRPCPTQAQVELKLPAGLLTAGEHTLRARAYDAAGNGVTAFGPRTITVASELGAKAAASARFLPDSPRLIKTTYGKRLRIAGTLMSNSGDPMAGAPISIAMISEAAAVRERRLAAITDGAGRYAFTVKATAARTIALSQAASAASFEHSLAVRSKLKLRAARSRVRALGRMRLTGRIPTERTRSGASVAIKVRSGRRWRTVGIARADKRGVFAFSYRFRRTTSAAFVFRAVALKSGDLAVTPLPSSAVRVRVG